MGYFNYYYPVTKRQHNQRMHQKTNACGSLRVSCHEAVFGDIKFIAAVFVSGDTDPLRLSNKSKLPNKNAI